MHLSIKDKSSNRSKSTLLQEEAEKIKTCKVCKKDKLGNAVPGEGNPDATIAFIGEAPGREEAKTGRPFVGRSGKFLRELIRGIGLSEEEVYITSPVKYLPKRGTPAQSDIEHGALHLKRQLEIIEPKIIVLLGAVAQKAFFTKSLSINGSHGKFDGKYFFTFHPAAAIRFPKLRTLLVEDFKKLKTLISKI